ncbi:Fur family transcriptional regulator [Geobacter pickeringii]|nr:transcriptional repressor [Geobacter pickeringii]
MEERCRESGLAITVQRRVIIEALSERSDHPSADQLYEAVRGRLRGISRTTVYRVLETLVGIGVVQKISNPEAKARFDADTVRHHHLYCSRCQKIQDLSDPALDTIVLPTAGLGGFAITDFSINFSGLCPACRSFQSP